MRGTEPFEFDEPTPGRRAGPREKPPAGDGRALLTLDVLGAALMLAGAAIAGLAMGDLDGLPDATNLREAAERTGQRLRLYGQVAAGLGVGAAGLAVLLVLAPADKLRHRVDGLRPLVGRGRAEVEDALGRAHETERGRSDGAKVLTWRAFRYAIALEFTRGVCTAVVREARRG
jgi:hypothetical protein